MTHMRILASFAALTTLAGCQTDTKAPVSGRASLGQVEKACTNRLAQQANVSSDAIQVTNSTGSTEGTAVFLSYNARQWVCRADGAGNITGLDLQGEG